MHFSVSMAGRFDVEPAGTLYLAEQPTGALLETARGLTLLSRTWRAERTLTTVELSGPLRVADTTHPASYRYGVTNTIAAGPDYALPQRLARDLVANAFDGVRYPSRYDVTVSERSTALFGTDSVRAVLAASRVEIRPIPAEVLDAVREYGIRAVHDLPALRDDVDDHGTSSAYG